MKSTHKFWANLLGICLWAFAWEVLSRFVLKDESLFPPLSVVIANTFHLFTQNTEFLHQLSSSAYRFLIALFVAAPLAYALALLTTTNAICSFLFNPLIKFTYPLPKVALIPFLLLLFGTGELTKILLIGLGIFYLIFLNTQTGARSLINGSLNDLVQIYKIKRLNYWFHFLIRGTFGSFLTGLTTGTGYGLTLVIVSEMSLTTHGLGFFIWSAWDSFRILDMYSGLLVVAIIGYLTHFICDLARQLHTKANPE